MNTNKGVRYEAEGLLIPLPGGARGGFPKKNVISILISVTYKIF
jgi:hypothetical protein